MKIILDNQELDIQVEENDTLNSIIVNIEEFLNSTGRVIYEMSINGEVVEIGLNISVDDIKILEVVTKTPGIILLEALQEMNNYIVNLENGINRIVDCFTEEKFNEAMDILSKAISGLEWVYNILISIDRITNLSIDNEKFADIYDKYQNVLKDILESIESDDKIMLSDMFEYEMLEILENLKEILPEIYDTILEEEKKNLALA